MRKIYLDTNILLDYFLGREGCEDATVILQLGGEKKIRLYCSILSIADTFFVLRKHLGKEMALQAIESMFSRLNVLPMGDMTLYSVLRNCGPDFEDSLQSNCAKMSNCDILITRNIKDYQNISIPVHTPKSFLEMCNG